MEPLNINLQSPPQNDKNKERNDLLGILASSIVSCILCGVFTSSPNYYESDQCISLLDWTKLLLYLSIFMSVASFLFYIILTFDKSTPNSENGKCLSSSKSIFKGFIGLASIAILVGLGYSYDLDEPCGILRVYILVVIVLACVVLVLVCCVFGCACAITLCTLFRIQYFRNSNNSEQYTRI